MDAVRNWPEEEDKEAESERKVGNENKHIDPQSIAPKIGKSRLEEELGLSFEKAD